jgi:hypothetical protein
VPGNWRRLLTGRQPRQWMARFRRLGSYVFAFVLGIATLSALVVMSIRVPHWQAMIDAIKEPKDRILAENEVIKTIAQILGGAFFLLGLYFTWRNLRLAQEGQITQRFNDAIEHLGNEKAEVRLGGIYALARIARDSPKDHMAVMHVFSSYVRETTKRNNVEPVAPEVQAILTMIGRRTVEHESEDDRIDLSDAYLPGVNLRGAQLEGVRFDGANLSRANLKDAHLCDATFRGAVLEDCYLRNSDLRRSDLSAANLRQGSLRAALLDGANIFGAQLEGCSLLRTDLSGVKNAVRQQIELAITDETTILPVYQDFVEVSIDNQ